MSSEVPAGSGAQDTTPESELEVLDSDTSTDDSDDVVVSGDKPLPKEEEEETEEEAEEPEEKEETEEEELEELEDETSTREEPTRPSWQTIKDKYPELAKDKDFRELYFRDKAYTDVFPTVADAKEAAQKAEALEILDANLVEGNLEGIFKDINDDVLERISDKLLPALWKSNKELFRRATQPLIINLMNNALDKAERDSDDNLKKSVRNVWRALTGNSDVPSRIQPTSSDPSVEAERTNLRREREGLFLTQQRNFLSSADRSLHGRLEKIILDGLDSKKELTQFARNAVVKETLSDVKRALANDEGLKNKTIQLYKLSVRSGFPDEYRARIVSASLERARKLVPIVRNKHIMAALGKQPTKGSDKVKVVTNNEKVTTGSSKGAASVKQIDTRKTSAEDFLNDKITYKK